MLGMDPKTTAAMSWTCFHQAALQAAPKTANRKAVPYHTFQHDVCAKKCDCLDPEACEHNAGKSSFQRSEALKVTMGDALKQAYTFAWSDVLHVLSLLETPAQSQPKAQANSLIQIIIIFTAL